MLQIRLLWIQLLHKSTQIQFARNVIFTFCSDEDANDDGPKGDDREGACQTSGATFIIVRAKEGVGTMENSTSGATPPKGPGYNAAITRNHDPRRWQWQPIRWLVMGKIEA